VKRLEDVAIFKLVACGGEKPDRSVLIAQGDGEHKGVKAGELSRSVASQKKKANFQGGKINKERQENGSCLHLAPSLVQRGATR